MTRLVFTPPGPETPGYLRRVHQALTFVQNINAENPSPKTIEQMVDFLAQYVTEPEEHDAKLEVLWMATEIEFKALLNAVTGEATEGESPLS